jgi:hypothetical protein
MNKRTQYLIDRKFQLRQTFSLIVLKFSVVALIIGAIAFNAVYNNNQLSTNNGQLRNIIENQSNVIIIQDNNVEALLTYSQYVKDKTHRQAILDVARQHGTNMKTVRQNITTMEDIIQHNQNIISYNRYLLAAVCFFVLAQGFFLYFMLIRKTHRISGPIYVMSNYMKQIIEGKIPEHVRKLRKNDELQEFYDIFAKMVESIKNRLKDKKEA